MDDLDFFSENIETEPVVEVVKSRALMKQQKRKQAKLELRARQKAERIIPCLSKMIVEMTSMIETNLKAQVKLSNAKFGVFVTDQAQQGQKLKAQLEN